MISCQQSQESNNNFPDTGIFYKIVQLYDNCYYMWTNYYSTKKNKIYCVSITWNSSRKPKINHHFRKTIRVQKLLYTYSTYLPLSEKNCLLLKLVSISYSFVTDRLTIGSVSILTGNRCYFIRFLGASFDHVHFNFVVPI